jgi:hypothetical protein
MTHYATVPGRPILLTCCALWYFVTSIASIFFIYFLCSSAKPFLIGSNFLTKCNAGAFVAGWFCHLNADRCFKNEEISMDSFVIGLALIASTLVIFLVGREVMCWYWKVNRIIQLLESIDRKLKD